MASQSQFGSRQNLVMLYAFLLICLLEVGNISCYKILVLPGGGSGSHYLYLGKVGEHLTRAGHDVTLLLGHHNDLEKTPNYSSLFTLEMYDTVMDKTFFETMNSNVEKTLKGEFSLQLMSTLSDTMLEDCKRILQNEQLLARLMHAKFDIVVMNNFMNCNVLIAQKLSLPYVIVSTNRPFVQMDTSYLGLPSPVSYVPGAMTGLTDKMTFAERLKNLFFQIIAFFFFNFVVFKPYDDLKQLHGIQPDIGLQESLGKSEIVLFAVDWALEFPRPVMPNTVFLGGLLAEESSPLDAEWKDFVDSADDGIVIFSFGSVANPGAHMPIAEMIMEALAKLPQKAVIRYKGEPPRTLGNNTKLTEWMPQNDLLGHPKTKAFIGHGGMNGVYQAIFHGVPMVGIPLYGDHYDNFARLTSKGMAVTVNVGALTSNKLYNAITTVINEPSYKENAMRLSRIHRDKPMTPGDSAVFWIEHVIKHGGQHLRPEALNLNFIQYFSLDVISFCVFIIFVIFVFSKKIVLLCFRWCCKKESTKEKTN
ncbi:UDP-glucuronosyltransferase 2C1-like [Ptychodera flava]|uniref:UDP-glucuronosyltransferase 2C1-like n=1 Tax=Ptychodera flava TaxID=63121 RepID=UPI00396A9E5A